MTFAEDQLNITILGAGAMGSLFGGYLSRKNNVWLVDVNADRVARINEHGIKIREKDGDVVFHPSAVTSTQGLETMDLVVVFVKAMFTEQALEANRHLIGKNTCLMTLQNGTGHEEKLLRFADKRHVVIGSTQHNSSIIEDGYVNHGGGGETYIGVLEGDESLAQPIADNMTSCGFPCSCSKNVKKQIWSKLFLNTAASSLTGILQVPLGFIFDDPNAHFLMEQLAREAVSVANAEGFASFDAAEVIEGICDVLRNARDGYTSIYADIKSGAHSEVDTISGSVVEIAKRLGVEVPYHRMVVALVHAMENKIQNQIN
ncbi:2-dehydropantoate 2-reductase [bioreactor metagenome]|uniref:2-dehydropantoate 2-reductase n=1 Tax=bioreactor metagenome TaxID=1076179 RepID=A0A644XCT2_9ZZZZ